MRQYLSDSIDDYLRFRRSQDFSKATLRNDQSRLKALLANVGNIGMWRVNEKHVQAHFEHASRTRQPQSLRVDDQVLRSYFEWARKTGRMPLETDPMYGRRRPHDVKRERNRVHVSQFGALLDAAEVRDPRDRILIAVMMYTLMRDGEVADLRIKDVDLAAGYLSARIEKKRGLEDRMPICTELDHELRKWLTLYGSQVKLEPMHYLVPPRYTSIITGEGGRIVGHHALYQPHKKIGHCGRLVKPALEAIGFPIVDESGKALSEGSHTIRRSGARALFDQLVTDGYDGALRIVQAMLHHSSSAQTERYLGITADRRTRDEVIRGQVMYDTGSDKVVTLTAAR